MRGLAARLWAFLRELSGEAALERRMRACSCEREAVKQAWREAFDHTHRCC